MLDSSMVLSPSDIQSNQYDLAKYVITNKVCLLEACIATSNDNICTAAGVPKTTTTQASGIPPQPTSSTNSINTATNIGNIVALQYSETYCHNINWPAYTSDQYYVDIQVILNYIYFHIYILIHNLIFFNIYFYLKPTSLR